MKQILFKVKNSLYEFLSKNKVYVVSAILSFVVVFGFITVFISSAYQKTKKINNSYANGSSAIVKSKAKTSSSSEVMQSSSNEKTSSVSEVVAKEKEPEVNTNTVVESNYNQTVSTTEQSSTVQSNVCPNQNNTVQDTTQQQEIQRQKAEEEYQKNLAKANELKQSYEANGYTVNIIDPNK